MIVNFIFSSNPAMISISLIESSKTYETTLEQSNYPVKAGGFQFDLDLNLKLLALCALGIFQLLLEARDGCRENWISLQSSGQISKTSSHFKAESVTNL